MSMTATLTRLLGALWINDREMALCMLERLKVAVRDGETVESVPRAVEAFARHVPTMAVQNWGEPQKSWEQLKAEGRVG